MKEILLDMDGVLANFAKSTCKAHGKPYRPEALASYRLDAAWGLTASEFWEPLSGREFWEGLEPYSWAVDLYQELGKIAPVTICTAPSIDYDCPGAKRLWLWTHLRVKTSDVVFANKKHLLAKPDHLLIDDSDSKVEKFREHGGNAILFPQHWNENRSRAEDWAWVLEEAIAR